LEGRVHGGEILAEEAAGRGEDLGPSVLVEVVVGCSWLVFSSGKKREERREKREERREKRRVFAG
jgi:hypothetical protein